jgi:hypothetical protein
MKARTLCLLLGAGLLTGCWQKSLNAFYTPDQIVNEAKIVGAWLQLDDEGKKEKGPTWTFTEGPEKSYKLEYTNNEEALHYVAHVFKFDGKRLMDIVSTDASVSTIPAHHLFKMIEIGPNLQMAMLNLDWMQKTLRENPALLAHITVVDQEHREDREKDEIILTADTKALQAFLREHSNDSDLFTGPVKLEPIQREPAAKK